MPRGPDAPKTLGRDLIAALGFGTLCFSTNVRYWTTPTNDYYLRGSNREALLACLAAMAIFAAVAFVPIRLAREWPAQRRVLAWLALPATLIAMDRLRVALGVSMPGQSAFRALIGLFVLGLVVAAARQPIKAGRVIHAFFRWTFAMALMVVGTLATNYISPVPIVQEREGSPRTLKAPILWIVFDELDQGWLFDHRPSDLKLPNFDRLAEQSLVCSMAERPGPETLVAIPALTTGKPIANAAVASRNDLDLTFVDGAKSKWSEADSVFAAMKRQGWTPAINGYYHNYPGVFDSQIDQIRTWGYLPTGFLPLLEHNLALLIPGKWRHKTEGALGHLLAWNRASATQHRESLEEQVTVLERTIHARSADFLFFHCRVPHWPWIFDYRTGKEGYLPDQDGYLGNLAMADQVLGRVVEFLKKEGVWNRTTLLVTSDHNLRNPIRGKPAKGLVPLLLKLPGSTQAVRVSQPVKAIDQRWLIEAIAAEKITTAESAARFLTAPR